MYLKKVHIQNIRSITDFEMAFEEPAGWHVLIGDNGAGKSTIIKAIALGLIGEQQAMGLRTNWADWVNRNATQGSVTLTVEPGMEDLASSETLSGPLTNALNLVLDGSFGRIVDYQAWHHHQNSNARGYFSSAFGPFRRFEGGNPEWKKVFEAMPRLGAHLSVFGEDVALTEALEWLVRLNYQVLEKHPDGFQLDCIKTLINSPDFLPNGLRLERISSEGVAFTNESGQHLSVGLLSDGYRSILSMTFELIRQLVITFGPQKVFQNIQSGEMIIDLPGVVLIDEIDVHLHPNWQTRIGQWFTKYFPKIQFIVTTHSPLICRASEKGSIWRLLAPGTEGQSGRISKADTDRLIYGNILDAYGTEVFGKSAVRSAKSDEKLNRLGRLNMLAAFGKISLEEEQERQELQLILSTDDPTGF